MPDYQQTFNRNYDAEIGRFIAVDPMPESAMDMTVYQYAGDNPIMMNDPDGAKNSQMGGNEYGTNHAVTGFGGGSGFTGIDLGDWFQQVGLALAFAQSGASTWNSGGGGSSGSGVSLDNGTDPTSTDPSDIEDTPINGGHPNSYASAIVNPKTNEILQLIPDGSNALYALGPDGNLALIGYSEFLQYLGFGGTNTPPAVAPTLGYVGQQVNISDTRSANQGGGQSYLSEFWQGATRPAQLDVNSAGLNASIAGFSSGGISAILKSGSKISTSIAQDLKVSNLAGAGVGAIGVVVTFASDASRSQGVTTGTWVKGAIGVGEILFPEVGLVYGGVDILTGLITGETLTDRIGDGVDNIH